MTQAYNSKTPTKAAPNPWAPNPQAQQTPAYTAESTIEAPRYIQDSTTQDAVNNTLAQGRANSDKRFQVKQLDRAGLSRGAGQNFMAAQGGVQQMQKAASAASEVEASDQRVNDQMRSDYERAREMETQNNAMIQHNLAQSDWARVFAQKSLNAQLQMAQMQAQLQLRLALMR
jgi:fructosamine-3-kinase